jgi:subtilisin-like proprotein convertase family protein
MAGGVTRAWKPLNKWVDWGRALKCLLAVIGCTGLARTLDAANTPPTIGPIPNQTVIEDQPTPAFRLTLNDAETPELYLQLSGASSDPTVVPLENIFFGVANGHHYVTVTPAFGRASGSATITVTVSDGTNTAATAFVLTVNPPPPGAARFYNSAPINIPNAGVATPYPSQIQVAGRNGTITNVTLVLSKFNHDRVQDLSMLLVGPSGQGVVILSHITGGNRGATNITVFLTDSSPYPLAQNFDLWPEPVKPTAYPPTATFPGAPAGPYGQAFTNFNGLDANGVWSLYIYDEAAPAGGVISGGWRMIIATDGGGALPPQVSDIPDQTLPPDSPSAAIPFVVSDPDTAADNLSLSTSSSNPVLIPPDNILLGGSGPDRTISLTPAPGQTGTGTITVTATDGINVASETFLVAVANRVQVETAADGSGAVASAQKIVSGRSLVVYAVARDAAGNFVANVSADSWSLANLSGGVVSTDLVPAVDKKRATFTGHEVGSANVEVAAGGLGAVDSGTLTVVPDTPPVISAIPDKATLIGVPLGPMSFTVGDLETSPGALLVRGYSSNQVLLPDANLFFYNLGATRTLTATPAPGQTGSALITLTVSDGVNITSTNFNLTVTGPGGPSAFGANTNALLLPNKSVANVYPSTNRVSGVPGAITKVTLLFNGLNHSATHDLEMLLVGPTGQKVVLFSHAWGGSASNITVGLDDGADYPLAVFPNPILTGTYRPTDYGHDAFPAPAPGETYSTRLAAFKGSPAEGDWLLYAMNDPAGSGAGSINGGWSLEVMVNPAPVILSVDGAGTTNVVITWSSVSNLTYRVQYGSNIGSGSWSNVVPDVTATGTTAFATDTVSGSEPRFYRVLLLP